MFLERLELQRSIPVSEMCLWFESSEVCEEMWFGGLY